MALTKVSGDFIQDGSITQSHLHASHGITTSDIGEGSNLYFTTARVDSRIGDLSTSNLSEGTNLYYTDARADARIALQVGSNLDLSSKSTSDLSEGTNLYYTQARFNTAFAAKSTSDLSEGTNLYYTDTRVGSYLTTNSYATQSYVNTQVSNLVDSAPSTLDTLNELAAALGDDANFSTTVTNSIATKLPLAGGTLTGALNGTTATFSGDIVGYDEIKSRGQIRATGWWGSNSSSENGHAVEIGVSPSNSTEGYILSYNRNGSSYGDLNFDAINYNFNQRSSGAFTYNGANIIYVGQATYNNTNWDTAYGWGNHASAGYLTSFDITTQTDPKYLRSNAADSMSAQLTMTGNNLIVFGPNTGWSKELAIGGNANNSTSSRASIGVTNGNLHIDAANGGYVTYLNFYDGTGGVAFGNGATGAVAWMGPDGDLWKGSSDNSGSKYWHAGNDGSGSGLDADTLDGQHASAFQAAGNYMTLSGNQSITGTKTFSNSSLVISGSHGTISFLDTTSGADDFYLHANSNNFYVLSDRDGSNQVDAGYDSPHPLQLEADTNTAYTFGNRILTTADEGSGNGIDADTLDGVQGGSFLRSDADDTFSGDLVSNARNKGVFGTYDSTKTDHIWSMGTAYRNSSTGANFGNLYGLAYKHTNNATGGTMAGSHQMVWCHNGVPKSAMGTNIWTDGIIDADGGTFGGAIAMNGNAIQMGNGSISGINHLVINDPGVNEGLQWTGGNNWYIQECPDAMTNASGNLQFSTGTTRRFTINTSGYVYAERYYDISSTGYYLDPGGTSNLNAATFAGDITVNGNQVITQGANADVKFAVWSGTTYGIGMTSGVTLGHLNDYAMTFCMNNDTDRGFWWGYSGQSKSAGAMALTTNGMLTVTNRVVSPNFYVDDYIYHNGDTDTYIRMIGGDDMQLVAGGRQMIRMDEGTNPDRLRFVTDSNWTDSSGNWAMSGYITVQGAVYSNDGIIYDKDDSSAYYRATGTSQPHGDIFFQSTNSIWFNSQSTSSNYLRLHGGTSSGAYFDFNSTGTTKKMHWRQYGTHTRFTWDYSTAAFLAMGSITANGSDERLKENIVTIDNALNKVKQMRGVYFNRTDIEPDKKRIGFIAQEVRPILPEVVEEAGLIDGYSEFDDNQILTISYANITALIVEAVKEQQTIIDDLKSRIETLENQ